MTQTELKEFKSAFRREIDDDHERGFDRVRQLQIAAEQLRHLRQMWPEEWRRVSEVVKYGNSAGPEHRGVREFKLRIAREIRSADESVDHLTTVSFVSTRVARQIVDQRKRRVVRGQLRSKAFGHEHSVPVDVILRILVDHENVSADPYEILSALSLRALLHREEISQIDKRFKSSLPLEVAFRPFASMGLRTLPLRMFGLARYHAAVPGLIDNLIPINQRAERLLDEFRSMIVSGLPGQSEPNLCFLPKSVIP